MSRDGREEIDGGILRDAQGRRQMVARGKHQAMASTDVPSGGTVLDGDGREQIVLYQSYDPVSFGADPLGLLDSSAAVLQASAALGGTSTAVVCHFATAGTYKLNLTSLDSVRVTGIGQGLVTLVPASATSPILQFGGSASYSDQYSYIDGVTFTTGGVDRAYAYPLIETFLSRNVKFGDDVYFNTEGYTALCMHLVGTYQNRWRGIHFRTGKYGIPFEWENTRGFGSSTMTGTITTTSGSTSASVTVTTGAISDNDQLVCASLLADLTVGNSHSGVGPYTVTLNRPAIATGTAAVVIKPTPQCDTMLFDMQVDGICFGIFRDARNDVHGVNFFAKAVQTNYYPTAPSQSTTLNGSHAIGASSITVASATGIVAGDILCLDPGYDTCEYVRVSDSYVSGTSVTLHSTTPLRFAHANAVEVFRGGVGLSMANGYTGIKFHEAHFEGQQLDCAFGNVRNIIFLAPYHGGGRIVHVIGDVQYLEVDKPEMRGTANLNEGVRRASNATGSFDGKWIIKDPYVPAGSPITPTVPTSYFPHATRNWWLRTLNNGVLGWMYNSDTSAYYATLHQMRTGNGIRGAIGYGGGMSGGRVGGTGAAITSSPYTVLFNNTGNGQVEALVVPIDTNGGVVTVNLPDSTGVPAGSTVTVVDEGGHAGTNAITLSRSGSDQLYDTVGGAANTKSIGANYSYKTFYCNGNLKWIDIT